VRAHQNADVIEPRSETRLPSTLQLKKVLKGAEARMIPRKGEILTGASVGGARVESDAPAGCPSVQHGLEIVCGGAGATN
jgi:hypothetical protein